MEEIFALPQAYQGLSTIEWTVAGFGAMGIGLAKAGIKGSGIFFITLLALVFGARVSSGLILPLLLLGDVFAVLYYKRHTDWFLLLRFIPWIFAGVLIGVWVGKDLPEAIFKQYMAIIILVSVVIMYIWEFRKKHVIPKSPIFSGTMGLLAGFTTMIGNLAGAFTNLYFLAMRISKNEFIGTIAVLYLIVNLFKLPFHIWVWGTINTDILAVNLRLAPAVVVGLILGIFIVKVINEKAFRKMILVLTAIGAILILTR